jgi:hypothetical protein
MSGREQSPTNAPQAMPFAAWMAEQAAKEDNVADQYEMLDEWDDAREARQCAAIGRALAEREAGLVQLIGEARLLMAEPRKLSLNRLEVATADIARRLAALSTGYVPKAE